MKRFVFLLTIAIITITHVKAQNYKVGVSLENIVSDFNWNKPLEDFVVTVQPFSLETKMPIKLGVCVQRNFKVISPSVHVNVIYRNIKYAKHYTSITNFNHYSLNVPINLNYRKRVSDESTFVANIGGGINYILTSNDKTNSGMYNDGDLLYSLQILKPDKPSAFVNCGVGWELAFENVGAFQFKVEYTYELSKQAQYQYVERQFTTLSNNHRINYLTYGLTYFLPIK